MQSNSFIAPYLASGSGLVNFTGGYALGPAGEGGARLAALVDRYRPNLRVLVRGDKVYEDNEDDEPHRSLVDSPLQRFNLRVDASDCAAIAVNGLQTAEVLNRESSKAAAAPRDRSAHLVACRLVPDETDHAAIIAQQKAADLVLDRLEDACPKVFQPRRMLTERRGSAWIRYYSNTDVWAWVSGGWVKFFQSNSGNFRTFVGRESDWARAPLPLVCGRRNGIYFVKVAETASSKK